MVRPSTSALTTLLVLGLILSCHVADGHKIRPKNKKEMPKPPARSAFHSQRTSTDMGFRFLDSDDADQCASQAYLTPSKQRASYDKDSVAFYPTTADRAVIGLNGGGYSILNTSAGAILSTVAGFEPSLTYSIAIDNDEEYILVGLSGDILVWELSTGSLHATLTAHLGGVNGIAFTSDGNTMVTGSNDGSVKIWSYSSGNASLTRTLSHSGGVNDIAISPDDTYVVAGGDSDTFVWTISSGAKMYELTLSDNTSCKAVAWDSDSAHVFTGDDSGEIIAWDMEDGSESNSFESGADPLGGIAVSSDDDSVYVNTSSEIEVWTWSTGTNTSTFGGDDIESSSRVVMNPTGTQLIVGDSEGPKVFTVSTGTLYSSTEQVSGSLYGVTFSNDSEHFALGNLDRLIILYETESLDEEWRIATTAGVEFLAFSPDDTYIAFSKYGDIEIVYASDGSSYKTLSRTGASIASLAYSPDGTQIVVGDDDGKIQIWTVSDSSMFYTDSDHTDSINIVAFSPDGTMIASTSDDDTAIIWDAETGEKMFTLSDHDDDTEGLAFSPDSSTLATSALDSKVILWDTSDGSQVKTLDTSFFGGYEIFFSPDGNHIVGGGIFYIFTWSVTSGEIVETLSTPMSWIENIAGSPDGKYVAVIGWDGLVLMRSCWGCDEDTTGICYSECTSTDDYWNPSTESCEDDCPPGLYSSDDYDSCVFTCEHGANSDNTCINADGSNDQSGDGGSGMRLALSMMVAFLFVILA